MQDMGIALSLQVLYFSKFFFFSPLLQQVRINDEKCSSGTDWWTSQPNIWSNAPAKLRLQINMRAMVGEN